MAKNSAPSQRSPLSPVTLVVGAIALVGLGLLASRLLGGGRAATEPVQLQVSQEELSRVEGISVGREDAPVVLYEFADFQCPACGSFAAMLAPLIKERLVEPGLVRYVYYDFPLTSIHPHAFLASRAGRCANEQGRFWLYHDLLYARQPTWSALRDATDYFVDLAGEAQLDTGAFEQCLRSDRYAEEVTRSMLLGESLGVTGTPSLFINGKRLARVSGDFAELERIVRQEAGLETAADSTTAAAARP